MTRWRRTGHPDAGPVYLSSDPPGYTITGSRMEPGARHAPPHAEHVYILWHGQKHVATLRVPADDDGARRAAVSELQRRAEECSDGTRSE